MKISISVVVDVPDDEVRDWYDDFTDSDSTLAIGTVAASALWNELARRDMPNAVVTLKTVKVKLGPK